MSLDVNDAATIANVAPATLKVVTSAGWAGTKFGHVHASHMGVRLNWGGLLLAGKADVVTPESQQNQ
ncbi:hypothetical protein [Pseudomonas aeruginosa]|uniref:hypothetical protein n=1 Tax=Pseudomonas aeruginosa TaxID=287 RepID=UPI000AE6ACC2|nr:hypothetical protein [Pseudomonas aeruginosa]MBH9340390.1 hypothetical protein [Pseudomonas aeruginosa]MBH9398248.1 hypothetical protein [Pseudomonas aeruginosa]HCF7143598.1 hypothetical protein [Pseudomonas aeruginosa]